MAFFKRVDSFDVTFADSFTRPELKVIENKVHRDGRIAKKGVGEKRIYCGHDEAALDKFFNFDRITAFFIQKDDLEEYVRDIEKEYLDPTYHYGNGIKKTYKLFEEYKTKLSHLQNDRLYVHFNKKYDNQNRYYLVLPKRCRENMADHNNYDYIRDVCLPRVSRLLFVKLIDMDTQEWYIYIKPFYGEKLTGTKRTNIRAIQPMKQEKGHTARKGQDKYKEEVFNIYSYCVVTKVTDPNLLIACHIKDYAKCEPKEQFDKFNGFTMTPTIHTLFDLGYLTFNTKGEMILSDFFRNMDRKNLHLDGTVRIPLREETLKYLEWHNDHVFIKTSRGVQIDPSL